MGNMASLITIVTTLWQKSTNGAQLLQMGMLNLLLVILVAYLMMILRLVAPITLYRLLVGGSMKIAVLSIGLCETLGVNIGVKWDSSVLRWEKTFLVLRAK